MTKDKGEEFAVVVDLGKEEKAYIKRYGKPPKFFYNWGVFIFGQYIRCFEFESKAIEFCDNFNKALQSQGWVRRGVCEWKYNPSADYFKTSCGEKYQTPNLDLSEEGFKGCPYCMNELKIKEQSQ